MVEISHAEVRRLLDYNPATGVFTWLVRVRGNITPGDRAGSANGRGRWLIGIGGKKIAASRLAWFWMTDEWPAGQVDHENTDPLDDRWTNLREATNSQNMMNTRVRKDNKLGIKGISFNNGYYRARVQVDGVQLSVSGFATVEEALAARRQMAARLHGEFAR